MAISFIGFIAASGTTPPAVPTHVAGDLIIVWADGKGNTTTYPSPPADYIGSTGASIASGGNPYRQMTMAWKIASTSESVVGTFGGTPSSHSVAVYRGATMGSVSSSSDANNVGTIVTYPELTLSDASGSSWVGRFHNSTGYGTQPATPSGYTLRSDNTAWRYLIDTNGGRTTAPSFTRNVASNMNFQAFSFELLLATDPGPSPTGAINIYNGTEFVSGKAKGWNGTEWKDAKAWNGSAWE